jgi:4-alpha-glucanotransferase
MNDHNLRVLARLCGVAPYWSTHWGEERAVAHDDLVRILGATGYPCANESDLAESRALALRSNAARTRPPLIVMTSGQALRIPADGIHGRIARLVMEDGAVLDMPLDEYADGYVQGAIIDKKGYHRLQIDQQETLVAVAPRRCFTIDDIAPVPYVGIDGANSCVANGGRWRIGRICRRFCAGGIRSASRRSCPVA